MIFHTGIDNVFIEIKPLDTLIGVSKGFFDLEAFILWRWNLCYYL